MQSVITFRESDTTYSEANMAVQAFALSTGLEITVNSFTATHINRGTYLFSSADITVPALISVTLTAIGPTTVVYDGTMEETYPGSISADLTDIALDLSDVITICKKERLTRMLGLYHVEYITGSFDGVMTADAKISIYETPSDTPTVESALLIAEVTSAGYTDLYGDMWPDLGDTVLMISVASNTGTISAGTLNLQVTPSGHADPVSVKIRIPRCAVGDGGIFFPNRQDGLPILSDGGMWASVPYIMPATESAAGAIETAALAAQSAAEGVTIPANLAIESAPGAIEDAILSSAEAEAAAYAALEAYDISHSSTHAPGTTLSVSELVGAAATAGPRTPRLVSDLFTDVRLALNDVNKNVYSDALMTSYYNRGIAECWNIMVQIGAEVIMNTGTIVADGVAQDYELPTDFRAFVPNRVIPRSPVTATTDYTWGTPFAQVGLLDRNLGGNPTTSATPKAFCVFWSGNSQYIRFSSIPPAGENYDFQYYPEYQRITEASITATYTPWLGLLDSLLARILEEFCREGLEFVTTKREAWRMKAENDLVVLLGLRHLLELTPGPSLWKGFPL